MTSADSLSLILCRLDEIERKLDRMMEELRPTAIGYSVRRGVQNGHEIIHWLGRQRPHASSDASPSRNP
jgi:hypothetical protein